MQLLRTELDRARARRAAATDSYAQAVLDGVILAIDWAIEDGGRTPPSEVAAGLRQPQPEPQPHKSDSLVGGNVDEIVAGIDANTDLDAIEAAENERERPRVGVLNAIEKERAARKEA